MTRAIPPAPLARAGVLALALALFVPAVSAAEDACGLEVREASGSLVARVESDGEIRNASGSLVGRFAKGEVRSASGSLVGRVEPGGDARNASGSLIGRAEPDGDLRNASGSLVGRVEPDGDVQSASGSLVLRLGGYSPGCRLSAAAYLFFFGILAGA